MINFTITLTYFELYLLIINVIALVVFGFDKVQALRDNRYARRVSENMLLGLVLAGGILGGFIAMILFRHKVRKISFIAKFIGVVLVWGVGLYYYLSK